MSGKLDDCRLLELRRINARQGNITPVEQWRDVPFAIERVYYLYDLPGGESRGGHAHRELMQLLVCVMGALDVVIDDGRERRTIRLDRAYQGLLICGGGFALNRGGGFFRRGGRRGSGRLGLILGC